MFYWINLNLDRISPLIALKSQEPSRYTGWLYWRTDWQRIYMYINVILFQNLQCRKIVQQSRTVQTR